MDAHPGPGWTLWIEIAVFIGLLIVSALLSAAAKAISGASRNNIRKLAEEGDARAQKLLPIYDAPEHFTAAVLVVFTFSSFLCGALAIHEWTAPLAHVLAARGVPLATAWAILLICVAASFLFYVFGRAYPKQIALQHTEGAALALAGFARFFTVFCRPFAAIGTAVTNGVLLLTRQHVGVSDEAFSEEDVMSMLEVGEETGVIKEEGRKMINSIFAFDDKLAYEIMTPRTEVFAIDINAPASDYINDLMAMRYSRIPVYDDDSDNIIGILNIKDYMIKAWEYGFDNVYIDRILRRPFFVPETKNIDSLFFQLQREKQHIAVLIDEYGGFSGIVTMEDLIEEVMGDIDDEYDEAEPTIEQLSDDTYFLQGSMDLDDVNEETGSELESDNSETVGGLLIDILGEIPSDAEHYDKVVEYRNYIFTIESVHDHRIEGVRMQILPKTTENDEDEDDKGGDGR
jgi:putative hemolysin